MLAFHDLSRLQSAVVWCVGQQAAIEISVTHVFACSWFYGGKVSRKKRFLFILVSFFCNWAWILDVENSRVPVMSLFERPEQGIGGVIGR